MDTENNPLIQIKPLNILPQNPEEGTGRFPSWLHRTLPSGGDLARTGKILEKYRLNTVCEEAKCP